MKQKSLLQIYKKYLTKFRKNIRIIEIKKMLDLGTYDSYPECVIRINKKTPIDLRLHTLFHEYGHYLCDKNKCTCSQGNQNLIKNRIEQEVHANNFAYNMLTKLKLKKTVEQFLVFEYERYIHYKVYLKMNDKLFKKVYKEKDIDYNKEHYKIYILSSKKFLKTNGVYEVAKELYKIYEKDYYLKIKKSAK